MNRQTYYKKCKHLEDLYLQEIQVFYQVKGESKGMKA